MISHFYLQRTEAKNAKQKTNANNYLQDKKVDPIKDEAINEQANKLDYGTIQSANTSSEFIMRAVIEQKKRNTE